MLLLDIRRIRFSFQRLPVNSPLMLLQMGFLAESVATLTAQEGSLFVGAGLMAFQRWFVRENLAATDALEGIRDHMRGQ